MPFHVVKSLSGLALGLSLLTVGGPLLGEWVATKAPTFGRRAATRRAGSAPIGAGF